jgi:hypothetical protein
VIIAWELGESGLGWGQWETVSPVHTDQATGKEKQENPGVVGSHAAAGTPHAKDRRSRAGTAAS